MVRQVEFAAVDEPLREDVGRLGQLIGQVLVEQEGQDLLDQLEQIRKLAIRRREHGSGTQELLEALRDLPAAQVEPLVRAFGVYFQSVNLAERLHRVRRRLDYQRQGAAPQPGGLHATLQTLKAAGVAWPELAELLQDLHIEPVFTAHPTEATRRTMLEKEHAVISSLMASIERKLTPHELLAMQAKLKLVLSIAWQTAEQAGDRPSVADELNHVSFYLTDVLYRVVPSYFEEFEQALKHVYGADAEQDLNRLLPAVLDQHLQFSLWVGGDMDGNPNVGAATIKHSRARLRALILERYRAECLTLARSLSQSSTRVTISSELLERVAHYRVLLPKAASALNARYSDMPYRQLLQLMVARLAESQLGKMPGYLHVAEFAADLALIATSLEHNKGSDAGLFLVQRLQRRVRCFGFHFAALDQRQDSRVHAQALAELLMDPNWPELPHIEQLEVLNRALAGKQKLRPPVGELASSVIAVFKRLSVLRTNAGLVADKGLKNGAGEVLSAHKNAERDAGLGPYIISMTRDVADVLAVLVLAEAAKKHSSNFIDVCPLFETIDDLHRAPEIITQLFANPHYLKHLQRRGMRQLVMLGYSDSSKDGGLLASRFALQRAQVELMETAHTHGVALDFFHGRGGSISRGGGKTERAVNAAPRGSVHGHLRLTEQGEVIHRKYGMRALAVRNLEQSTAAVLKATLRPRPAEPRETQWREQMSYMAECGSDAYRQLIYQDEQFIHYYRLATPIDVIERMRIGSRPARRGNAGLSSLRAIPWVFSWAQTRSSLSAWYGVGTGLEAGIKRFGFEAIAEMARDWAFFDTLIDDIEMVLAKADIDIAERYSKLAGEALHEHFFPQIKAEFERCKSIVLKLKSKSRESGTADKSRESGTADTLLSGDPRLANSIRLRNPYIDPLSLLQVQLLQSWRAAGRPDDAGFTVLLSTVNGISQGLQNTG